MTPVRPPVLATWLLDRLCADEGLTGDLIEEFGHRGSKAWYWREALASVVAYAGHEIVAHKWLALRAIVTGWVVWFVVLNSLVRGALQPWIEQAALTPDVGAAWAEYARWAVLPLMYVLWIANGWIIGRLHRPYQSAMVFAYVVFALAASVPVVYPLLVDSLADAASLRALTYEVVTRSLTIASLLAGGVLSTCGAAASRGRRRAPSIPHALDVRL